MKPVEINEKYPVTNLHWSFRDLYPNEIVNLVKIANGETFFHTYSGYYRGIWIRSQYDSKSLYLTKDWHTKDPWGRTLPTMKPGVKVKVNSQSLIFECEMYKQQSSDQFVFCYETSVEGFKILCFDI